MEAKAEVKQIPEELKPVADRLIGKRVLIVKRDHPHANKAGTVDRLEFANALGRWGFVVNYDDGLSGFVFHGSEWKVLD
jgi:hypothetical protein